ncbi:MAG: hypothetical protein M3Q07_11705 [Pseudobdellovibrionaceae bacterium]|nr:hypothetical protein [Pseudobdellovibrionaceae bacterium]
MEREYDFEVRLTSKEYSALMDIRGLAQGAHFMVMCADRLPDDGWLLKGSHADFDALTSDLWEELDYNMAPKKNRAALRRIIDYITPEEDEEGVWGANQ